MFKMFLPLEFHIHEENAPFQDHDRAWVRTAHPNKEFFNATHMIVTVPPYYEQRLTQPIKVYF